MHAPITTARGTLRPLLRLAWPVLVEQLLVMLVGLVDLWLTGNYLQRPHLAAIGLMSYVLWLLPSMFGIVAIGATGLDRSVCRRWRLSVCQSRHQSGLGGRYLLAVAGDRRLSSVFKSQFVALTQLKAEAAPLAVELPVDHQLGDSGHDGGGGGGRLSARSGGHGQRLSGDGRGECREHRCRRVAGVGVGALSAPGLAGPGHRHGAVGTSPGP